MRGRNLFAAEATFESLERRFAEGQVVKATKLSPEFDYAAFRERYGEEALPLFFVTESGSLAVCTAEKKLSPKAGQTLISLVDPQRAEGSA
jgi:CPA1 family monovalent cation:H+ antiporter